MDAALLRARDHLRVALHHRPAKRRHPVRLAIHLIPAVELHADGVCAKRVLKLVSVCLGKLGGVAAGIAANPDVRVLDPLGGVGAVPDRPRLAPLLLQRPLAIHPRGIPPVAAVGRQRDGVGGGEILPRRQAVFRQIFQLELDLAAVDVVVDGALVIALAIVVRPVETVAGVIVERAELHLHVTMQAGGLECADEVAARGVEGVAP